MSDNKKVEHLKKIFWRINYIIIFITVINLCIDFMY